MFDWDGKKRLNTLWQIKTSQNSGKIFEIFFASILEFIYTYMVAKHNLGLNHESCTHWLKLLMALSMSNIYIEIF